jgi:hypothetical protein
VRSVSQGMKPSEYVPNGSPKLSSGLKGSHPNGSPTASPAATGSTSHIGSSLRNNAPENSNTNSPGMSEKARSRRNSVTQKTISLKTNANTSFYGRGNASLQQSLNQQLEEELREEARNGSPPRSMGGTFGAFGNGITIEGSHLSETANSNALGATQKNVTINVSEGGGLTGGAIEKKSTWKPRRRKVKSAYKVPEEYNTPKSPRVRREILY